MFSFFKRFKRKAPAPRPAPVVPPLDELKGSDQLVEVIETVKDKTFQIDAIARITDVDALEPLTRHAQRNVREAAKERLFALLLPDPDALPTINDSAVLVSIAATAKDDALAQAAIGQLGQAHEIEELARNHPAAQVRFAAAQNVHDLGALEALAKHAQGRDKRVFRLCRDRLDAQAEADRIESERVAAMTNWFDDIEALCTTDSERILARIEPKAALLKQRWAKLDAQADAAMRARAQAQLARLGELVEADAAQRQRALADAKVLDDASKEQAEVIEALHAGLREHMDIATMEEAWKSLSERWREAVDASPGEPAILERFDRLCESWWQRREAAERVQQRADEFTETLAQAGACDSTDLAALRTTREALARLERQIDWPKDTLFPPQLVELDECEQRLRGFVEDLATQGTESLTLADNALSAAQEALEAGQVKQAMQHHRSATNYLKRVEANHARAHQQRAQTIQKELRALQDWQTYAVEPKREALCQSMEALIDSNIEPQSLADQISELQRQWKMLTGQSDRAMWQRFKAAADKAYEPCKEHFSGLAVQRQQTLEARFALCEELEKYEQALDWENADWALVRRTLEAAQKQFRELSPVDRAGHTKSRKRFQSISDLIYSRLKGEYAKNLDAKAQIVERAAELAANAEHEGADLAELIETAKRLQSQWQAIGAVPNRADQKMWRAFRKSCDFLFEQRDAKRTEHRDAMDATIAQAEATTASVEESLRDASQRDAEAAVKEANATLNELSLPSRVQQRLSKRLQSALDEVSGRISRERTEAESARWAALLSTLANCRERGENTDLTAPTFGSASIYPKGIDIGALEQRWICAAQPAILTDDETLALRTQCIDAEIALSEDTPDADRELRMARQMERLATGFGEASAPDADLVTLINGWLPTTIEPELDRRFSALIERAMPKPT
ncbi:MAG: DUF349 domain-containing protein [Gammaproteobacteria bacterium]|nr:DUF349 domain-containing protein [Gammaproteobacteria bacterium]